MTADSRSLRVVDAGELVELRSTGVGIFVPCVVDGQLVSSGQLLGHLETLGVRRELRVPEGVTGRVRSLAGMHRVRVATAYGEVLASLSVADVVGSSARPPGGMTDSVTLSFNAPMSGRFYARPSPQEASFVAAGDTVTRGQTIGLLEVMKTFNRLVYQGAALPEAALVVAVLPSDGDDVTRGDPILELDPGPED